LRGDADISIRDCDLPSKTRQAFVFVEQPSSEPGFCEGSWKHKLRRFASQQSEWNEQKLIQIVTGICGDLEERCENAEKPFREAEERAAEMERVVADLREHNTGLEQQAVDLNFRLSVMEAEKAEVQDALQGENERLIERVHALERALKESNDDAEAQIDRLISKHKARDLELRTMITEKEVLVDELSAECEEIRKIQRTTESTLQQTENRAAGLIKEVKDLQSMLNCQKHELEEQKKANQSLDHEMQELKGDREETVKFLNALQQKYDQRCREAQQSASDHMAEVTRLESRLQEDASRHAKNVQDMQKEEAAEKRIFREKEEQLLASLEAEKASKEDLQRQQKQVNSTLHNQQKQIEQLQEIVATKEEEIAKFQAMRQTLAAAIGQLPRRKHSRKSVQYAPSAHRPLASRWQSSGLIGKHAASSLKNAASDLYGGKAFPSTADVSFESESTQTGSTPKQAKPRKPFKVPTIRQPCVSTISTPKSVKVRSQRLPLTDISAACDNKLPSCQVASVKSLKFDHNSENVKIDGAGDADELEFDSEISISTPFTLAAPQCSVGHDVDETVDE
jgi:chromosome segregation ATPase